MLFQTKYISGRTIKAPTRLLFILAVACSSLFVGMMTETTLALRAPVIATGGEATYYYVSDNIKQNGDFPNSYVAFYWKEPGTKTITYTGRQCNNGGYEDNTDSDVFTTIYPINADGTANLAAATILRNRTNVNRCHDGQDTSFTFTIPASSRDSKTGLYGAVAYVAMNGKGRAFFTLNTNNNNADGSSAMFGALGTRSIGYSRDFNPDQRGFYNITLNFGNICSTTDFIERIRFYDVDHNNKYQRSTMTFRVKNVDTNTWLNNTDGRFIYSSRDQISRSGSQTTFNITSGSGDQSSIQFNLAAGARYQLEVRNISEMNDIGVSIPSSEIYGKATCGPPPPPPATYQLLPAVSAPAIVSVGEQVTFKTSVTNNSSQISKDTNWTVLKIVVPLGKNTPPPSRTNGTDPNQFNCNYYNLTLRLQCSQLVGDSGIRKFNPGSTPTGIGSPGSPRIAGTYVETMNYPSGSRVCYAVMVNSASGVPQNNISEAVFCPVVGKSPTLEASNGDVWAGGNFRSVDPDCVVAEKPVISSSQRQITNGPLTTFYTSYATYGVTSLGLSNHFGSQGMSYENLTNTLSNNLVFGNTKKGFNVDGYFYNTDSDNDAIFPSASKALLGGVKHCLNDPFDKFGSRIDPMSTDSDPSIDISLLPGNTLLTSTSTIKVYASQPINKKIVVYAPDTNIEIVSNITYLDQPYSSINQIPQVVVMSGKNITIRWNSTIGLSVGGKVTQLDGIYAAKKNLYTCDWIPLMNVCNTPLKINGAVVTGGSVVPLRTAGAEAPDYGAMAETFNLRSDVLLNQLADPNDPTVFIKTISEREVPPRF